LLWRMAPAAVLVCLVRAEADAGAAARLAPEVVRDARVRAVAGDAAAPWLGGAG